MNFAEMMIIELLEVTTPMDFARMGSTPGSNTPTLWTDFAGMKAILEV
jgi:hypothetical protein